MDDMRPNIWLARKKVLCLLFLLLFLVACGGGASTSTGAGDNGDSSSDAGAPVVPTMPSARFTAVGQQSVMTQTTSMTTTAPVTSATVVTDDAPAISAADLTRGASAYARNNCAECHGENGEGVAGKGKAIAGTTLTENEFTNLLRTGGGLGNTHIFGPSAVSPGGMTVLYAYVQSLQ
jgi:mono/diheme cytochrome c family protein